MKQIEGYVGYQIVQVCKAHRNRAEAGLSALGLHAGQEMILFLLWAEEGLTNSYLAERLGVEPPTVSKMLQRMECAGLVERRADSEDARVSRVYLTPHARELEELVLGAWRELEEATVRGFTETEQALLRRLLLQVRDNLT